MNPGGELIVSTNSENGHVIINIEDTGKGIADEDKLHLFTPFFTTKSSGSGLGLPISKKIVEDHGGRIELVSRVSAGSKFTVYFPQNV